MLVCWSMDISCNRLEVLFQFYLWDQSHVTIVWNTRETSDIDTISRRLNFFSKGEWESFKPVEAVWGWNKLIVNCYILRSGCCVFRPGNRCSKRRSLVETICFCVKTSFFLVFFQKRKKERKNFNHEWLAGHLFGFTCEAL